MFFVLTLDWRIAGLRDRPQCNGNCCCFKRHEAIDRPLRFLDDLFVSGLSHGCQVLIVELYLVSCVCGKKGRRGSGKKKRENKSVCVAAVRISEGV